ncbi:hypothetical protein ACFO3O_14955 [Dokdonia ponticola]|uniref:Terpene synthase n=1 Tax=Dokdonia ponticola TaxID=2041041 RepID=A0ABV9I160_9FLAO
MELAYKTITKSTDLTISKTKCTIHEHSKEILEKAQEISEKLGIVAPQFYKDHTTMTTYLYAGAPVSKMIDMQVNYDVLYYFDDFFGEDTKTDDSIDFTMLFDTWQNGSKTKVFKTIKIDQLYTAIAYISNSIKKNSTVRFFEKYTKTIQAHLYYSLQKKPYETVNEYIDIRLHTGGMLPVIELIEYAYDVFIDDALLKKVPSLYQVKYDCALIGALSNDLFSYSKEKHSDYNLVNAYLKTKETYSYGEAVSLSIKKVNDLYTSYKEGVRQVYQEMENLEPDEKQIINVYLKGIHNIIAASYHWQIQTNRYKHPENVFFDMRY